MNDLPSGWRWVTLDEITGGRRSNLVIGPFGSNLKVSDYRSTGIPLVFVRNIRSRDFSAAGTHFISEDKARELQAHEVAPGDVLITKMGDPPGDSCVYAASTKAIITADCIRLRPTGDFSPRFISLAFESPVGRSQILQITRGVAQKKVSLFRFRSGIKIPAPSLPEQERIVEVLEDHLSRLDAATRYVKGAWARIDGIAVSMLRRHSLLADAETRPLEELLERPLSNGRSVRSMIGGFPVLRLTALTADGIDLSQRKDGAWTAQEALPFLIERGDFLISRGNGTLKLVGRGGLVLQQPDPVAYPDTLIRVRVDEDLIHPEYLALMWNSPIVRTQLESMARTTAGIYKINQQHLRRVRLPIPTLDNQRRVSDDLLALRDSSTNLRAGLQDCEARASSLRRSLMDAAFSGRLNGQTTDDEITEEITGV